MLQAVQLVTARQVPHPQGPVVAAGEGAAAIRGKGHTLDPCSVSSESTDHLPSFEVPQPDVLVVTARTEHPASGKGAAAGRGDCHGVDVVGVSLKAANLLARPHVP